MLQLPALLEQLLLVLVPQLEPLHLPQGLPLEQERQRKLVRRPAL